MSVPRPESQPPVESGTCVPGKILVVDDECDVLSMLAGHLGDQGYAVEQAVNADEALAALGGDRPDLVLLDVGLPGMNGFEVLERIRRDDPGIVVIMMTGDQDVALARASVQMGADDYVFKPFDLARLDRAVASGIARTPNPGASV